jgi:glycosyltransferase involved in cell wall biosynthesis
VFLTRSGGAVTPDMKRLVNVLELRSVRGTGGGPEKTIMLGAAQANRSAVAVTVCYIRDRRDDVYRLNDRAARLGIDYVEVHERNSFDPAVWPKLKRLIRDKSIDIVHAHEYKTDLLALLLGWRTGVIPLATVHGWTGQSTRERILYYPLDKRILARYPRVIAVSSEIRRQLVVGGCAPERVNVLLNSIDPRAFCRVASHRAGVRESLGLKSHQIVIGAVGRLERQKRFDLLLEAIAPLMADADSLQLVIVGDGSLRRELVDQATELKISDRCRFLGQREDIANLHHAFDLYVQSSEYEGTPNSVLEAMAMETPIVATDVGGTVELARPDVHAIIVPPCDGPALRMAVRQALADPERARGRAISARRRVETELSFDARTRRLEQVYLELARQRRVARGSGADA